MKRGKENIDELLNDHFNNSQPDRPGSDFTQKVMDKINVSSEKSIVTSNVNSERWNLVILASFIVVSLAVAYYFLSQLGVSFLPDSFTWTPVILPVFENIYQYLKQIFDSVSISPVTVVIILGVLLMIIFERFINIIPIIKNIRFSL